MYTTNMTLFFDTLVPLHLLVFPFFSIRFYQKSKSIYCPPKVLPNSSPRSAAAFTARSTISAKPEASKLSKAACVVPLGLVTFFLNCAGDSLPAEVDSTNIFPAPKQVCVARRVAWDSESPRRTALVMRCSTRAKK